MSFPLHREVHQPIPEMGSNGGARPQARAQPLLSWGSSLPMRGYLLGTVGLGAESGGGAEPERLAWETPASLLAGHTSLRQKGRTLRQSS